jgi:hypothetical protein
MAGRGQVFLQKMRFLWTLVNGCHLIMKTWKHESVLTCSQLAFEASFFCPKVVKSNPQPFNFMCFMALKSRYKNPSGLSMIGIIIETYLSPSENISHDRI